MPINSKRKGKANELAWAHILRAAGFKDARRGQQYRGSEDSPDVICKELALFHQEVKSGKNINIWSALDQAWRDKGLEELPIVAAHKDRKPWIVAMLADDWLTLVKLAMR
jgi:hypothetical protein